MSKEKILEQFDALPPEQICVAVNHVTKDYKKGRGIFDITFKVPKGKTFGYCGTNGAGKTTTLRSIMGFIQPDKGHITVNGLDARKDAELIKQFVSYLPGEIAFPAVDTGSEFLKIQAEMIGLKDMSKAEKVINMMQLDPTANLKRMSKGMKQKTAIVVAFMANPSLIILDEPTTGLDPLMREAFISLIKEEKAKGTTIIMSNHMFDELEETCDYIGFIKDGHLIDIVDMDEIKNRPVREYEIKFKNMESFEAFQHESFHVLSENKRKLTKIIEIKLKESNQLFEVLRSLKVSSLTEKQYTLEQYFMEHVAGGK